MNLEKIKKLLSKKWFVISKWLSDKEILNIEKKYNINFPIEYKHLLIDFLPLWWSFIDWRNWDEKKIKSILKWPLEWIIFDVKNNNFWYKWWWNKSNNIDKNIKIITDYVHRFPILIPIYWHRYIPWLNNIKWLPVFSVRQTDIIYYWYNLENYFEVEFWNSEYWNWFDNIINIDFWGELIKLNNQLL